MPSSLFSSLRSRILTLVLGLVTLVLAATIAAVVIKARVDVERQVSVQLRFADETARETLKFRGSQLSSAVEILTSDFGFKEAIASADSPTLLSALENQRARIGADLVIVLNSNGIPISSTQEMLSPKTSEDLRQLVRGDPDGMTLRLYRLLDGRPYQLVLAPVHAPDLIGWAAMAFALDDRIAANMSRLLGVQVSFLAVDGGTAPYVASSMDAKARPDPMAVMAHAGTDPFVIEAQNDKLYTLKVPIHTETGELSLVFQRSLASALKPYLDIRNSMLAIGALLLAVASMLSALLARSTTRPVEDLTKAAESLEAGDYSVAVPPASSKELKQLARSFDAMRIAVADREATIRHQAGHDAVTGLPNRSHIAEVLDAILPAAAAAGRVIAVCRVELQQFQSIVGSFGHAAGDEVLCEVARRLAPTKDKRERVAHLGTGQFIVLLDCSGRKQAEQEAHVMVERLRSPSDYTGVSFQLEACIGVAIFPDDGAHAADLLQRADLAMFRARDASLAVGVFVSGDDELHRHRLEILGELRRAIASDELELYYQPKVNVRTGAAVGCEALVRWNHPQKGFIPPCDFVPHAERSGAIRSLTLWVLGSAFRQLEEWRQQQLVLDVSINISPMDLADPGFADSVERLLHATGADASRVVLEVTESGAMKDLANTLRIMERLRVLGIRFSIDDFGTGYSSLAHLRRLPVDEIKIDRSFVQELEAGDADDVIVRSTINLGHAMHIKVVAEGVEIPASWDVLANLGCDLIQGYFVSKPLPAAQFSAWLHARSEKAQIADREGRGKLAPIRYAR
jgi:diguanylate cyclase (GGDEF)-like protein